MRLSGSNLAPPPLPVSALLRFLQFVTHALVYGWVYVLAMSAAVFYDTMPEKEFFFSLDEMGIVTGN